MNNLIIDCKEISKSFLDGSTQIAVLNKINLQVSRGEKIAIIGRSGSGKTTLLQLLGGLDQPTTGTIKIDNIDLSNTIEKDQAKLRNKHIGFIYQLHHLISEFTAVENTLLPLLLNGQSLHLAKNLAIKLLTQIGMGHRLNFYPNQLSGGEKQRVAIARAIINNPTCILADEPTGSLDLLSANIVMDSMEELANKYNTAIIMVTHDLSFASRFDKIYTLENSKLI